MFHDIKISRMSYRSFPFKGKARINQRLGCGFLQPSRMASCFIQGMGSFVTITPIPTPTLPLKEREFAIIFLNRVP